MKMDCYDGNGSVQATARSMHPAGANISFCDGTVTYISDSINTSNLWTYTGQQQTPPRVIPTEYGVWERLMSERRTGSVWQPSIRSTMFADRIQHRACWSAIAVYGCASALALAAISGCSRSQPYSCVKVSGKVTYKDGSLIPAQRMRLIFVPQTPAIDPKTPPKDGMTEVDVQTGKF